MDEPQRTAGVGRDGEDAGEGISEQPADNSRLGRRLTALQMHGGGHLAMGAAYRVPANVVDALAPEMPFPGILVTMVLGIVSLYLFAAVLTAVFLAAFAGAKGRTPIVRLYTLLSTVLAVYLFGYLMELNSQCLESLLFWNQVQYAALPFLPALWFLVAFLYTRVVPGNDRRIRMRMTVAILMVPTVTFLVRATNRLHGWYYSSTTMQPGEFFPVLRLGKGPWYFAQSLFVACCFIAAVAVYLRNRRHLTSGRRYGFGFMLAAALVAVAGHVLVLLDPVGTGLDFSALLLPWALGLQLPAILRFDFLSVRSLAREVVFQYASDGIVVVDDRFCLTDWNDAARRILPALASVQPGGSVEALFPGIAASRRMEPAPTGSVDAVTVLAPLVTAEERHYSVRVVTIRDRAGATVGALIQLVDITAEERERAVLLERASTDDLTGLANRRSFLEQAEVEFQIARRRGISCAVAMLDIDHFKQVNDTRGHAVGDEALRFLAQALRSHLRRTDIAGRLGGEEFAIMMPATDQAAALQVAEKLRIHVETFFKKARSAGQGGPLHHQPGRFVVYPRRRSAGGRLPGRCS
jgi:diguanylate cyclase (GGDEF)-like protein